MFENLNITVLLAACAIMAFGCKKQEHQVSMTAEEQPMSKSGEIPSRQAEEMTPATVESDYETAAADTEDTQTTQSTYVVQKKDTLWSIAKKVYGDGQRWKDIVEANPGLNPRKLHTGQKLNLPPK